MRTIVCAALLLTACHGGNRIETRGDPPFEISKARSVLWAQDPETDEDEGFAVLVISEDGMDCGAITSQDFYYDIDEVVLEGQGLMFALAYDSWGNQAPPLDWEGLWMSGYGYGGDAARALYPLAFSDGFLYFLGGYYGMGETSWLYIDAWATGGVSGSYSTEYWAGDFYAENCGDWAPDGGGDDSEWDTYW